MANKQLLEDYWKASGKSKTHLAQKINVSRPRLYYIFECPESATMGQADGISKELGINAKDKSVIFLP